MKSVGRGGWRKGSIGDQACPRRGVLCVGWLVWAVLACTVARGDDLYRGAPPERGVQPLSEHSDYANLHRRLERLEQQYQRLDAENQFLRQNQGPRPVDPRPVDPRPFATTVDGAWTAGWVASQGIGQAAGQVVGQTDQQQWPAAAPASALLTADATSTNAAPAEPKVYEIGKQTTFTSSWRNGLPHQTEDNAFRVHVGGRLHNDFIWWNAEDNVQYAAGGVGPLRDGANYRRARIRVNGTMYDTVDWVMEYGFEVGAPAFFDTYGELPHLPYVGAIRIGHFREPFSMDALTSGNHLTFMERSLIHDAFVPFRNVGMMAHRNLADESMTFAIGGFRGNSNLVGFDGDDGTYALTSRVTWNPWFEMDGAHALHLGAAVSSRAPPRLNTAGVPVATGGQRRFRFATRPEIRVTAPEFVDTGAFQADHLDLLGLEFGFGSGPLLVQAEYVWALVDEPATGGGTADRGMFQGFYAQSSWFLTGENRPYQRRQGIFGGARPHENFFCVAPSTDDPYPLIGRGAWEAAVRYSWLDLNDGPVQGGQLSDVTLGLNWHLSSNSRFMWNYVLIDRVAANPASSGWAGAFAMRFQIDF